MIVVLDTNILVSGLTRQGGIPSQILDLAAQGRFSLSISNSILTELSGVLTAKFGWTQYQVAEIISDFRIAATIIHPPRAAIGVSGHASDDLILDCVAAANADFLVTGDRRHLLPLHTYANARIVTAAEFLEELERAGS